MSEEKKKRLKEYQKNYREAKNILHNEKMHFKITIAKIFFVCSCLNFKSSD